MKTTLILIRHGQSEANLADRFAGFTDADLSEKGSVQARMTAEYIAARYQVDAVYASDLKRAFKTAKATADLFGLPVIGHSAFREIYAGEWEGKLFSELQVQYPEAYGVWQNDIGNARCTGGESVRELSDRVYDAALRVARENLGKTVVIGTHATPVRVLQCRFQGVSFDDMHTVPWVPNASVTVAEYENGSFRLIRIGESKHLGDLETRLPDKV